jgi:hypothetical protein
MATFDVAAAGGGSTEPLSPDDPRAGVVADYLERITRERGFTTKFSRGRWEGVTQIDIAAGEVAAAEGGH